MPTTPLPHFPVAPRPYGSAELAGMEDSGAFQPVPRLWRSRTDRVFLGVLGGLSEKYGWETKPIRILVGLFGFLSIPLATLPVTIPYLVLSAIARAHGPVGPPRELRRSRSNQVVAGVLGGVASWLGISRHVVRTVFCGLTVLTVLLPGIVTYLILWAKLRLADPGTELAGAYDASITQP